MSRLVNPSDLRPHPLLRSLFPDHTDEEREKLKASIKEHGFKDPITCAGNVILDGHQRWEAAKELGLGEVPVIRLADRSEEEEIRLGGQLNSAGRAWTNEEKRETARRWLQQFPEWSDRRIAECIPVSHAFVGKVRRGMQDAGELETVSSREARDGSRRPARKTTPTPEPEPENQGEARRDADPRDSDDDPLAGVTTMSEVEDERREQKEQARAGAREALGGAAGNGDAPKDMEDVADETISDARREFEDSAYGQVTKWIDNLPPAPGDELLEQVDEAVTDPKWTEGRYLKVMLYHQFFARIMAYLPGEQSYAD